MLTSTTGRISLGSSSSQPSKIRGVSPASLSSVRDENYRAAVRVSRNYLRLVRGWVGTTSAYDVGMKLSTLLVLSAFALPVVACGGSVEDGTSEDALTESRTVKVLESSAEDGVLKSSIAGAVSGTSAQRAAETILKVASWSQLKANGTPVFSSVELVRDDKVSLAADGVRKVKANVYVSSSYGDIKIPVNLTAKRTGKVVNIKLVNESVSVFFTTVLEDGGIKMDLTLTETDGGVALAGTYNVELQAGQENAPKMELLGPLYDWAKPRMKAVP
jgi:hypothetical protein